MKTLKKLKLNQLSKVEMDKNEMKVLRGGCGCGCHYSNSGGSSTMDNANANQEGGYTSYGGNGFTYSNGCWTRVSDGAVMTS